MKRTLPILLATVMLFGVTSAAAVEIPQFQGDVSSFLAVKAAEKIAYMDIDDATPDMTEKILEARDVIINNTSWAADEYPAYVEHVDGSIEKLPSFSEVFPDWDLPTVSLDDQEIDFTSISPQMTTPVPNAHAWKHLRSNHLFYLSPPNLGDHVFSFFAHPHEVGDTVRTYVNSLTNTSTCNVGYTDLYEQEKLGHYVGLKAGESLSQSNVAYRSIGIRLTVANNTNKYGHFTISAKDRLPYND